MTTDPSDFDKRHTIPGEKAEEYLSKHDLPSFIGPYKIESLLERGGMSFVYLATHPETKQPVTVKVLSPKFLKHPEVVKRFFNEAEVIAMADHPNIVKLYGHGEWEGGLYIAMEFIEGISLRQHLEHHPLSLKQGLELILEIAYALCHLHTHNIIHRDLKLENVLMTEENTIKLIDFGIAQLLSEDPSSSDTPRQRVIGTPIYMSPEQRKNPETVSYPSDIYSLGIIAYELVLGKLSHGKIHLSLMPQGLQIILSKALQPVPEDRYQDIVDFITDLSTYLHSATIKDEIKGDTKWHELIDKLREAEQNLTPTNTPKWAGCELSIHKYKAAKSISIYHEFIEYPNGQKGIFIASAPEKGAEAIVYTSVLHGMLKALHSQTDSFSSLIKGLKTLIEQEPVSEVFSLNLITFSDDSNEVHYLHSGDGSLWLLPKGETTPLSIFSPKQSTDKTLQELTQTWEPGSTLIYTSFVLPKAESGPTPFPPTEKAWKEMISQASPLSPSALGEALFRKIKHSTSPVPLGESIAIVCMCRNLQS